MRPEVPQRTWAQRSRAEQNRNAVDRGSQQPGHCEATNASRPLDGTQIADERVDELLMSVRHSLLRSSFSSDSAALMARLTRDFIAFSEMPLCSAASLM